jgi:hypothetical protein
VKFDQEYKRNLSFSKRGIPKNQAKRSAIVIEAQRNAQMGRDDPRSDSFVEMMNRLGVCTGFDTTYRL